MASHHDVGKRGEELAAAYIRSAGYRILHRNWRYGRLEVDIIAQQGNVLVFVEVKARSSQRFGMPEEAVNGHKRELLLRAAHHYLVHFNPALQIRFDIISISFLPSLEIFHFEDAF